MRGCLKHPSPSPSPSDSSSIATPPPTRSPTPPLIPPETPSLAAKRRPPPSLSDACLSRRCVHFCSEIVDKIFVADEWDRSPAEVTPRLTYQDMLELKAIQRSLPHAVQPFNDPDLPELDARGVPRTHFLNAVPVGLVPLISPATSPRSQPKTEKTPPSVISRPKIESPPCQSPPSRPPPSPPSTPPPRILVTDPPSQPPKPPSPPPSIVEPWVPPPPPPRLPYNIPFQPRPVPRFNFLPLLETPAPPAASTSPGSDVMSPQRSRPSIPVLPSHQDLPRTPPARTPSPRDEKIGSSHPSSLSQSRHNARPTDALLSPADAVTGISPATALHRPSDLLRLLPLSPLPSPSPSDTKDAPLEDTAHLEAELTRLWHSHSSSTDGETEAEESEAESSVVHTEADSDGECARLIVASGGATKVIPTPVAVSTASDVDDDEEAEMSLVELENGVMTFVRIPRRR